MNPRSKSGIIVISGLIAIITVSFFIATQGNEIATFYYSITPPMSKCGTLPSVEPSYLASQLEQIKGNSRFIQLENGSLFQYATNSQMIEQYYNGSQFSILQVAFVHLTTTSSEDVIYVQMFQNGTVTSNLQHVNVGCFEPGGSRG